MLATKINLKNCVCRKCHKAFQNNTEIIHTVRELNHNYCFDCEGNAFINSVRENNSAKYVLYYAENGIGKLDVDCDSFDMLPCGIYELKLNEVKKNRSFIVQSVLGEEEKLSDFLKQSDSGNYILEKQNFGSCLFFPEYQVLDTYDFYDNRSSYKSVSRIFQTWIKKDEYGYVFTPCKIIGIASKSMCHYESQICKERRIRFFDVKTIEDIEKMYADNESVRYLSAALKSLTPAVMLDYCQKRIQGQGIQLKKAVYKVYKYMQAVAAGQPFQAENWLLTSPSGTGKTEFYRTIRDLFRQYNIPIPVVQIDLSQITETGYKGANVSTIPQRILSEKKGSSGIGICFLDEADKKCIPSYG
ncbi:MAG: hypothetical protein LUG83_03900, partial [Lachnospiraceae bacterium]|nr:hypothetical protein [Lachnospiraceae bacterium]